jgi:hypothetical protein
LPEPSMPSTIISLPGKECGCANVRAGGVMRILLLFV